MPSSRLGQVCYVVFGTLGLTAGLLALYFVIVIAAVMMGAV